MRFLTQDGLEREFQKLIDLFDFLIDQKIENGELAEDDAILLRKMIGSIHQSSDNGWSSSGCVSY